MPFTTEREYRGGCCSIGDHTYIEIVSLFERRCTYCGELWIVWPQVTRARRVEMFLAGEQVPLLRIVRPGLYSGYTPLQWHGRMLQ